MKNTCLFNAELSNKIIVIGKNLKRIRNDKKLTQQELAYLSGNMERSTISNIERFNCDNITLKVMIKLCIVMDIELEDLIKNN